MQIKKINIYIFKNTGWGVCRAENSIMANFSSLQQPKKCSPQPKIHRILNSLLAVWLIETQTVFLLQLNDSRVHLEADRDHLAQTLSGRIFGPRLSETAVFSPA